jgi:hypothetical protein
MPMEVKEDFVAKAQICVFRYMDIFRYYSNLYNNV